MIGLKMIDKKKQFLDRILEEITWAEEGEYTYGEFYEMVNNIKVCANELRRLMYHEC